MGKGRQTHRCTEDGTCRRNGRESREGLLHEGSRYKLSPSEVRGAQQTGASGRSSEDGKESITFPEQRTRGPGWLMTDGEGLSRVIIPRNPNWEQDRVATVGEGMSKRETGRDILIERRPGLKPYWGKPTVRNFRGGDGDSSDFGVMRHYSTRRNVRGAGDRAPWSLPERRLRQSRSYIGKGWQSANLRAVTRVNPEQAPKDCCGCRPSE